MTQVQMQRMLIQVGIIKFFAASVLASKAVRRTMLLRVILPFCILCVSPEHASATTDMLHSLRHMAQATSAELTFWESVRDSEDPREIEAYLNAYPNGQFAPLARIRLNKLKSRIPDTSAQPDLQADKPGVTESPEKRTFERLGLTVTLNESADTRRGILGVRIANLTSDLAESLGLGNERGALVTEVTSKSAAALAGLKALDFIIEFDRRDVTTPPQLAQDVAATPPGSEVSVVVMRPIEGFTELSERLRKEAEEDDGKAACALAWLYGTGVGIARDHAEAARWYRRSADRNYAEGMYQLGLSYSKGQGLAKDYTKAASWFRRAAEKSNPGAAFALGSMYATGRGVTKDASEAMRWYRKAADLGQANAMHEIGSLYATGQGVAKDDAEAVIWFRKAVEEDNANAMASLGFMYENGRGVFKDDGQALRYYRKGADQGHSGAMYRLGVMYLNGNGTAKDDTEAMGWFRKAASRGHSLAAAMVGWIYANGRGVARDEKEALRWYRKAADQGNAFAMYNLGVAYEFARGVSKDAAESVRWYRKASERGNTDAMHNLGAAYDGGNGIQSDPRIAAEWVFKAIKGGNQFAINQMTENAAAYTKEFRREFQRLLRDAGLYDGPIDGSFGPATTAAVEASARK